MAASRQVWRRKRNKKNETTICKIWKIDCAFLLFFLLSVWNQMIEGSLNWVLNRPKSPHWKQPKNTSSQKHAMVGHYSYQSHRLLNYGRSLEHLCDHNRLKTANKRLFCGLHRQFALFVFHLQNNCLCSSSQVCSMFIKHLPVRLLEISVCWLLIKWF